ncbi:hypothetical protein H7992_14505 [Sporosarcina sp. resist]|uniref:hypothetical protein n=1 Tax=Sporosarcina sp. resist TaxID=2762563 RepID=UPI00164D1A72|nr:hypothetical protein [Sporosarcina sp. resist]QNK86471.1 hypothetical protein H7992_14505 [Sporosarcina sp. resist]
MEEFSEELHERYAAVISLRIAFKKLKEGDIDLALHRAEDAVRSLKALQEIKKAN